jgi:hypothetical protein
MLGQQKTEQLSGAGTPHDAFKKETMPKALTLKARKGRFSLARPNSVGEEVREGRL